MAYSIYFEFYDFCGCSPPYRHSWGYGSKEKAEEELKRLRKIESTRTDVDRHYYLVEED